MDMKSLMEQAKSMQTKVAAAQDQLGNMSVKGVAGSGDKMVIVEMSGKYDLIKLIIMPGLLTEDAETIAAVVASAFNDAKSKADAAIDKLMGEATAGLQLPE
jgi:DNA-binding YbaB/EbfC family protein